MVYLKKEQQVMILGPLFREGEVGNFLITNSKINSDISNTYLLKGPISRRQMMSSSNGFQMARAAADGHRRGSQLLADPAGRFGGRATGLTSPT